MCSCLSLFTFKRCHCAGKLPVGCLSAESDNFANVSEADWQVWWSCVNIHIFSLCISVCRPVCLNSLRVVLAYRMSALP